ncbi:MAG: tetratricopeptide repeat protein [bacterium]
MPLTLWVYIPVRASIHPPLNWGCPDNWQRFVEHLSGKLYHLYTESLTGSLKSRFFDHLGFFAHQFNPWLIPFGFIGFIFLIVKRLKIGVYLLLMVITNIIMAIRYNISNIEDYYIPSFLVFALFIGYSVYSLYSVSCILYSKFLPNLYSLIPNAGLSLFFLLLPILQCRANYYSSDHSKHYIAYDYGRNVSRYIKKKAMVFFKGGVLNEPIFTLWYLQNIERHCIDTAFIVSENLVYQYYIEETRSKFPDIIIPSVSIQNVKGIIENNLDRRPIYLQANSLLVNELSKTYNLIHGGIFPEVAKKAGSKEFYGMKDKGKFNIRKGYSFTRKDIDFEDIKLLGIFMSYAVAFNNLGNCCYDFKLYQEAGEYYKEAIKALGILRTIEVDNIEKYYMEYIKKYFVLYAYGFFGLSDVFFQQGDFDRAIQECENGLELDSMNKNAHWKLGFLYLQKGMKGKAVKQFEIVLNLDPNNIQAKQILEECKKSLAELPQLFTNLYKQ